MLFEGMCIVCGLGGERKKQRKKERKKETLLLLKLLDSKHHELVMVLPGIRNMMITFSNNKNIFVPILLKKVILRMVPLDVRFERMTYLF